MRISTTVDGPTTGGSARGAARRPARRAGASPIGTATRAAVAGTLLALLAGACSVVPRPLPDRDGGGNGGTPSIAAPCAEAAMRSCALPYPSDEFTVADPSRATGRRVEMPAGVVSASARAQLGPGAGVADAFGGADGFSAVGPVVFELDRSADPDSLPRDGGDVLAVFDLTTGERVPIRAEFSLDAIRQGAPLTIVQAWPRARWEFGHTYVARLTDDVRTLVGRPLPAPGMADPGAFLRSVRADLARVEGDRWGELLAATRFTVRSRADGGGDLERMAAVARTQAHRVRNLEVVAPALVPGAGAVVSGQVELSDFRDEHGVAEPEHGPTPNWERFLLVLPARPAGPEGAPVVVYGHGLTVAKETMLAVAGVNAAAGMATIGIDVPNHGDRQQGEGGYLLDLTKPSLLGRLASMPLQGVVDHVSLVQAVVTSLADLDASPWRPDGRHGDGLADLDTSRLFYEGTSMGGVLGIGATALLPELQGAFVQVPGTGIADIIFHSLLWPLFSGVVPSGTTAGDAAALEAAATMLMDRADHVYQLDALRDAGPPVFVQYGVDDGVVPNVNTDRLLHLLDLPLIGPELRTPTLPVRRLATDAVPADGRGAVQVWATTASPELRSIMAHVSFTEPRALEVLADWVSNRLVANGLQPPAG